VKNKWKCEILGPGCPRCHEVEKRTMNALIELDVDANIEKITDIKEIAQYKILGTPGLVINGKVKCFGRVPSLDEIKKWIREEM